MYKFSNLEGERSRDPRGQVTDYTCDGEILPWCVARAQGFSIFFAQNLTPSSEPESELR